MIAARSSLCRITAALLITAWVPATGAAELRLHLDQVPAARALVQIETVQLETTAPPPEAVATSRGPLDTNEPMRLADLAASAETPPATDSEAWLAAAPAPSPKILPAAQGNSSGGFGRWLKRHWYVPVLAAAAVGLVVLDSDDDDAAGEEDE
jgi:hypothetical protein